MALDPSTNATMAGRVTAADANYPFGSSKNETTAGAGDGTPYFKARADDIFGFQQALLEEANIAPSGNAETAVLSQYLEACKILLKSGRKNKLYGLGLVNQEAVSGTVVLAAGEYGHDGFRGGSSGGTYTFIESNGAVTFTITVGTLEQEIIGTDLDPGINDYILSWSGTADGRLDGQSLAASPSLDSLTGGTNAIVEWSTGTLVATSAQLERGDIATPAEETSVALELTRSRKFYREIGGPPQSNTFFPFSAIADNSTVRRLSILHEGMASTPAVSVIGGVGFAGAVTFSGNEDATRFDGVATSVTTTTGIQGYILDSRL